MDVEVLGLCIVHSCSTRPSPEVERMTVRLVAFAENGKERHTVGSSAVIVSHLILMMTQPLGDAELMDIT